MKKGQSRLKRQILLSTMVLTASAAFGRVCFYEVEGGKRFSKPIEMVVEAPGVGLCHIWVLAANLSTNNMSAVLTCQVNGEGKSVQVVSNSFVWVEANRVMLPAGYAGIVLTPGEGSKIEINGLVATDAANYVPPSGGEDLEALRMKGSETQDMKTFVPMDEDAG